VYVARPPPRFERQSELLLKRCRQRRGLRVELPSEDGGALARDGAAQLSVVWADWDGEFVVFNTAAGRAKPRNLERDPRCTVLVYAAEDPYRWIAVRGHAALTSEGADEHIDRMARKYTGSGWTHRPHEQRLIVRVRPEHVTGYGE
jgi:PPOX class probable F420-dependent enzyme